MKVSSNADELGRNILRLFGTMDFDHGVGGGSLGKRMAEKTAEMIASRSIQHQKGAVQQWEPNKEPYRSRKAKEYGVHDLAGVRTGQMLSQESLRGETKVSSHEVEMVYGTNAAPTRSATGHITEQDKKVTDRQKAGWFTDGSDKQSPRPFYELDEDIAAEVMKIVEEFVDKTLKG